MRSASLSLVILLTACTTRATEDDAGRDLPDAPALPDGGPGCGCAAGIHVDRILVLSDDSELWSFEPRTQVFERLRADVCAAGEPPYSMAVDATGRAHVLLYSSRTIRTFDVGVPAGPCGGFTLDPVRPVFPLFGMAFSRDPVTQCESLYVHSYSGVGPFDESPGALGVVEASGAISTLATIMYDGGELAGTGDGRLFALAGVGPAKVIEYDRATGATIETLPLTGFSKTNASAMAFFAGDLWLFTEALPAGCEPCLEASCAAARDACRGDLACAADLACLLERADVTDACGGSVPTELQTCVLDACMSTCGLAPEGRTSRVTRLDWDGDRSLTTAVAEGPIRVVGAGTSTCVQTLPF
jgi:hypothetical protein